MVGFVRDFTEKVLYAIFGGFVGAVFSTHALQGISIRIILLYAFILFMFLMVIRFASFLWDKWLNSAIEKVYVKNKTKIKLKFYGSLIKDIGLALIVLGLVLNTTYIYIGAPIYFIGMMLK